MIVSRRLRAPIIQSGRFCDGFAKRICRFVFGRVRARSQFPVIKRNVDKNSIHRNVERMEGG